MKVSEPEIGQESERTQRQVDPDTNRHNDVYAWLLSQANRLREYRPEAVDWLGLAEELEDIVALQRAKVVSLLSVVQAHLLKWHYYRIRKSERSWRKSLVNARTELNLILDKSRILRNELPGCLVKAYAPARRLVGTDIWLEKRDWEWLFPNSCPWTSEEILDQDFFPALAPTANGRT